MTDYTGPIVDLPHFRYGAILADPAWRFELRSEKGEAKSPQAHYRCMPTEEIAALPVGHLAAGDCLLFLWATFPMLPDAFEVMRAWGFQYVTGGAWGKRTKHGKRHFGPGYVLREAAEIFLIGRMGAPVLDKSVAARTRNFIEPIENDSGLLIEAEAREHSRKPPQQYELVETLVPNVPRLELFSRHARPGWDCWGDEAGKFETA